MAMGNSEKERDLLDFIYQKLFYASREVETTRSERNLELLRKYHGRPWRERKGKSKVNTREVMETVEWVVPIILRTYWAAPNVVEFVPIGPGDEGPAGEQTEAINHLYFKDDSGEGFIDIGSIVKNGILYDNTYVKVHMEEMDEVRYKTFRVGPEEMALLDEDEDIEIMDVEEVVETMEEAVGETVTGIAWDVSYKETKTRRRIRVDSIPPDEILIDPEHDHMSLEECAFSSHRKLKTGSQLKAMGLNIDDIEHDVGLILADEDYNEERMERLFFREEYDEGYYAEKKAHRRYWLYEIYCNYDYDDDGYAEYRKIRLVGSTMLENEAVDFNPIISGSAIFMPNAHQGVSPAGLAEALQDELTVLKRNLFDNTYSIVRNRKYVRMEAIVGTEQRLRSIINSGNELVTLRGPLNEAIQDEQHNPVIADLLPVMQDTRAQLPQRTGIAPENSIDPAILQQATVGAFIAALDRAGERVELYTRTLAETIIKPIMRKLHYLYRMYPDVATPYQKGDKWYTVNPLIWKERNRVRVNVGLGYINKQQMIASLLQLIGIQQNSPDLMNIHKKYNAFSKLVEVIGLGSVDDFFVNPEIVAPGDEDKLPEPPPSPELILATAQAQSLQADSETKRIEVQGQLQIEGRRVEIEAGKAKTDERQVDVEEEKNKLQAGDVETRKGQLAVEMDEARANIRKTNMEALKIQREAAKVEVEIEETAANVEKIEKEAEELEARAEKEREEAKHVGEEPEGEGGGNE